MLILAGFTIAAGILSAAYIVVGLLMINTELSYQMWVNRAGYVMLTEIVPFLLLVWGYIYLRGKLKGRGRRLLAAGMGAVYLFCMLCSIVIFVFTFHEERRLTGDLLIDNVVHFPGENRWVYYREKGIFFRVQSGLEDEDRQRYLEEKYEIPFQALAEKDAEGGSLFRSEEAPDVAVSVYRRQWELEDTYVAALTAKYLEEGYYELGISREMMVEEIVRGEPYFYLVLEGEEEIGAFCEDARRLLEYVTSRTSLYEEYRGVMRVYWKETESGDSILFGKKDRSGEWEDGYWLDSQMLEEYVSGQYEKDKEAFILRKRQEALAQDGGTQEEADPEEDGAEEEALYLSNPEDAALRIYEEAFKEQGYAWEVCYNAKGNLYIDLGSGPADTEEAYDRYTLVYDRPSENGKCELFVLHRTLYRKTETGRTAADPVMVEFYAVEKGTGRVIAAGKNTWSDVGSEEYQEATGEL